MSQVFSNALKKSRRCTKKWTKPRCNTLQRAAGYGSGTAETKLLKVRRSLLAAARLKETAGRPVLTDSQT